MYRPISKTVLSLFVLSSAAFAQVTTTSMVGTVTDPSGALISGATVTATDLDRNQSKTVTTGQSGGYRIDFLLTGNYSITVSANGFKKYLRHGLQLNAGAPVAVDVAMSTGEVSDEVQVDSGAPLVNTVNAEVGTTIDKTEIVELPLVNRNAYQLLDLTPGVQTNSNIQSFGGPAQVTLINGGSDNGAGSVNYFLDGAPNLTGLRNTGNILPNPDALEEFRVQTSNYGAPYGRFASGIVNANVKSGTNQVHGTIFEFIRNQALNARDWNSVATLAKPPLHRNQFGATIGGPIYRDRTFFFGSYAGLRQTSGTLLNSAILPTAAEQTGDFRASAKKPNVTCNGVQYVLCSSAQDVAAVNLLKAFLPASNATLNGAPSWQGYFKAPFNSDDFLIKVNQRFSDHQQLSMTYFNTSGLTTARGGSSNVPYSTQQSLWRQQNAVVNDTLTLTPNIVNNVWASYTRYLSNRINTPTTSLADFGSSFLPQGDRALPNISVTGFITLGDSNAGPGFTNNYALRDLVTWSKGKHTIQFGAESVLDKSQKVANLTNFGSFTFNGGVTGNAFADFLEGVPSAAQQDAPAHVAANTYSNSTFLQDDLRLNRKLTLNLGVRWDIQTPPVDPTDRESAFVPGQKSTVRPNAPIGLVFPGDNGITRGITKVSYRHFSPRVGFAYDPYGNGKTAIRGGFGVFWGSVSEEAWMASGNTIPYAIRYTFSNVSNLNGARLANPYQGNPGGNPFPYTGGLFPVGGPVQPTSPNARFPYTYQINLQVQQQITSSLALTVAYVGSLSREQLFAPDLNYASPNTNYGGAAGIAGCPVTATIVPTVSNVQCRRPYQPFGTIYQLGSPQTSSFHSLQTTVTKHMSNHISIQAYHMWSRSMSSLQLESSGPGGSTVQDGSHLKAEHGRTDNDIRHIATIAIVWQPDYYRGHSRIVRGALNGWEVSPLTRFRSGTPFTIANGADANLDGLSTDRAQVVGNPFIGGHTLNQWFNTAAFKQNVATSGAPVDGNQQRNLLTGPGSKTVDLNLARTFPVTERVKFQFRAEASNALNIVNWSNPNTTITQATTFGRINSAGQVRQLQFGGKILF